MWAIAGIASVSVLIAIGELPYLIRKRMVKELFLFVFLLCFGVTISVLQALRVPLPNPLDWITAVSKPISDWLFGMLKSR